MNKEKIKEWTKLEKELENVINIFLDNNLRLPSCGVLEIKYDNDKTSVICFIDENNSLLKRITIDSPTIFKYITNKFRNKIITLSTDSDIYEKLDYDNIENELKLIEINNKINDLRKEVLFSNNNK